MGEYSDGDPFEDASDGDGSCGEEEDDDGCLGLSRGPSDDDSNGEGMCEVPCCFDDDDDDDIEEEELCGEEGNGEELVDDPCDEDDYEGDVEAEDLCEDPSSNDGEHGEREVVTVSVAEHTDSDDDIGYDTDYDDDDEYEQHRQPASRAAVESLPEAALDEEEAARGCAVCKDVFAPGQRVVRLPCKHYFHGDCICPWLAIRSTCPMCRYQLPTDDAESRQAPQLGALVPAARHGGAQQSGDRDGGDGSQATTGGGDIDVASGHGST
ncbi:uncharacterized protein [Lolium perenne]|uniref:uncharacterized protein n=1 Tax=Lolium perenne TaxID=4522 RepID=UPI0021F58A13|nr:E3 ubiquitin-protein ligase CIP8-like [Lolium perenne]